MKKTILSVGLGLACLFAGCDRPPPPEGAGRATTAPNSRAEQAKGDANTSKNMGATPVSPGAEKQGAAPQQTGK